MQPATDANEMTSAASRTESPRDRWREPPLTNASPAEVEGVLDLGATLVSLLRPSSDLTVGAGLDNASLLNVTANDGSTSATALSIEHISATWTTTTTVQALIIAFGSISVLLTASNILLLAASKFTSGGRTPVLIFVRSLCVADAMTGAFGMCKMSQVLVEWRWTNCFLPESLLFSATLASALTHLMLTSMCYSMLRDLVRFDRRQDKHRSIFSMIFLWNGSFVVGFIPHMGWNVDTRMGWNSDQHPCRFLAYFSGLYMGLLTVMLGLTLAWLAVLHLALQVLIGHRRQRDPALLELTWPLVRASRVDLLVQVLCYTPGALYLFLPCSACASKADPITVDTNLWLFVPLMTLRAVCSTALHVTRTRQLRNTLSFFIRLSCHKCQAMVGVPNTRRPERTTSPLVFLNFLEKSIGAERLAVPGKTAVLPQRYSWRQEIKGRLSSQRQRSNPERPATAVAGTSGHLATHPTIPEEPSPPAESNPPTEKVRVGSRSSTSTGTPSRSNSNVTLASTMGSVSGGSVHGSTPPGNRKVSIKSRDVTTSGGGLSASPSRGEVNPNPDRVSGDHVGGHYWKGVLPQRQPQPLNASTLAEDSRVESFLTLDRPASALVPPQRHLLWARSPVSTHLLSGGQTNRRKEHNPSNSRPHRLESEVEVHVSAQNQ